jgi:hypothetical protein
MRSKNEVMKRLLLLLPILLAFGTSAFSQLHNDENELIKLIESGNGLRYPVQSGNSVSFEKLRQLIVHFENGVDAAAFVRKINQPPSPVQGLKVEKILSEQLNIWLLSFEQGDWSLDQHLRNQPGVISASWNQAVEFRDSIPNDPLFNNQWDMERIGLPDVWNVSTGGLTANGHEIVVAVLDKGFDLTHPDLQGNIWENPGEIPWDGIDNDGDSLIDDVYGWNFQNNTPFFTIEKHGTNVSGIIGGKGNNGMGMAGVNWNVKLMFLSVRYADEVVSAFDYVLKMRQLHHETNGQKGAFIVVTNGSFGIDGKHCSEQPAWGSMYDPLGEAGVLSVAATANENWDVDEVGDIPTSCTSEYLIAVTSTDKDDNRVSNAAFGKVSIDLGAPGQSTTTTNPGNTYNESFGGTSSACPHVAGSVALLYSMPCTGLADLATGQPDAAARLVRDAIFKSVDRISSLKDKTATDGRLNVLESMKYLHAWCIAKVDEREAGDFKETYFNEKKLVRVYPNPVAGILTVEYSNEDFVGISVKVYNALGQQMEIPYEDLTQPFKSQKITIDVSDWSNGTYFISLLGTDKKIVEKFVKM